MTALSRMMLNIHKAASLQMTIAPSKRSDGRISTVAFAGRTQRASIDTGTFDCEDAETVVSHSARVRAAEDKVV